MSRRNKSQHARRRENDRKYFKLHPEEKINTCEKCGKEDSVWYSGVLCKLQFHHERYDVPRVGKWLCDECHMTEHGTKPNLEKRAAKAARKNKYAQFSKSTGEQQPLFNPEVQGK